MQESESSVRVSQIFCRLAHAEKQISACIPRPATRQHASQLSQHCWTVVSTIRPSLNYWANDKVTTVQPSYCWTSESTTKLLLNHLVYKKDTTQLSSLQQTRHWIIEDTTEILLNHWFYNKSFTHRVYNYYFTTVSLCLRQNGYCTIESATEELLNTKFWSTGLEQDNISEFVGVAVKLCTCIHGVFSSNLIWDTGYFE
jgi:hypothetical protein